MKDDSETSRPPLSVVVNDMRIKNDLYAAISFMGEIAAGILRLQAPTRIFFTPYFRHHSTNHYYGIGCNADSENGRFYCKTEFSLHRNYIGFDDYRYPDDSDLDAAVEYVNDIYGMIVGALSEQPRMNGIVKSRGRLSRCPLCSRLAVRAEEDQNRCDECYQKYLVDKHKVQRVPHEALTQFEEALNAFGFAKEHRLRCENASFVLDFYHAKKRLCIEIDGKEHFNLTKGIRDRKRDRTLYREKRIVTCRFALDEILQDHGLCIHEVSQKLKR